MLTPSSFSVNAWRILTLWFRNNRNQTSGRSRQRRARAQSRQIFGGEKSDNRPSKESGSSSLRVKVASTSDARSSSNVGNTTAALNKSRHLFRVEISGPFYNKTRCAIESMQAAEEEDARGTVQQRCAYRPARRQDQFSTERDDLCRNLYNEQRCRMPP
jgi:hypothetical protein